MKSKINKTVAMSDATMITLTITSPIVVVSAQPKTAHELYKDAYNLMEKALEERTQQSVNNARKAIQLLVGTDAAWAVGEFSKQVDTVQEELFRKFMNIIYYEGTMFRKETLFVEEINEARALVNDFSTYEGNKYYISTWSSVVDQYVQVYINNANQFYDDLLRAPNKENKDKVNVTDELKVSYKKINANDLLLTLKADKPGDYRLTFTNGREKGYMLVSVFSDFTVGTKCSRCATPYDGNYSTYLDNDIETLGLVITDKTTIISTNPEIARFECDTKNNLIKITAKSFGTDYVKITNGETYAYVRVAVSGTDRIDTSVERPWISVLDDAHKDLDFIELMIVKDNNGDLSDGIYVWYDMKQLRVEAYKEGTYEVICKDKNGSGFKYL